MVAVVRKGDYEHREDRANNVVTGRFDKHLGIEVGRVVNLCAELTVAHIM